MMKVLSIHFGLSLGGVAKYAKVLEGVHNYFPVRIKSLCILPRGRIVDQAVLNVLDAETVKLSTVFDLSWVMRLSEMIRLEEPDCIISHGFNGHFSALIGRALTKVNVPFLATYHGSYHGTTPLRALIQPIYNSFTMFFLKHHASAILSVAKHAADHLVEQGVNRRKISVVHNGIPDVENKPNIRSAIRAEWGLKNDHFLIGTASRLDPIKGIGYLIDAFANIEYQYPTTHLIIMGEGTMGNALKLQVKNRGIGKRVHFVGMRNDISECLQALDIFALPSLSEYHSIGLIEAMRAGLAIVSTDVGGNTESVRHELEGLVVKPASSDDLAEAMIKYLDNPPLRKKLSHNARKRFLLEFTEEKTLQRTADWLQRVYEDEVADY